MGGAYSGHVSNSFILIITSKQVQLICQLGNVQMGTKHTRFLQPLFTQAISHFALFPQIG